MFSTRTGVSLRHGLHVDIRAHQESDCVFKAFSFRLAVQRFPNGEP
jgi:hypothetical protein